MEWGLREGPHKVLKAVENELAMVASEFPMMLALGELEGPDWTVRVVNADDVGLFVAVRTLGDGTFQEVTAYQNGPTSYCHRSVDAEMLSKAQGDAESVLTAIRGEVAGEEIGVGRQWLEAHGLWKRSH